MLTNKNILITGSKGFIGIKLKEYLISKKYKIREYNEDVTKPLIFNQNFDVIIHLAAKTSVTNSLENPLETMRVNVLGTLNVLELAKSKKAKVIFISTAGVYDVSSEPVKEDFSLNPKNPYVQSKYFGEELCKIYSKNYNVCCLVLRLFNVYGYPCKDHRVTQDIMDGLLANKKIELSSPNLVRDYVHLDEVNEAIRLAIDYVPKNGFGTFNIGSGVGTSVSDLVKIISEVYGKKANVEYTNFRKSEVSISVADLSNVKNFLCWTSKIDLQEGVKKMIAAYS